MIQTLTRAPFHHCISNKSQIIHLKSYRGVKLFAPIYFQPCQPILATLRPALGLQI